MLAPELRPYSAEKLAVLIETSSMKSIPTLLIWLLLLPESMLKPPSTVSRLVFVRLPLTEVLMARPVMMLIALSSRSGEPGMSVASCRYWRPLRARFCTCSRSTTRAISPETVFTVSPWTDTSTTSLIPPTSSRKSAVTRPSATSWYPAFTAFLKPDSSALAS